ncbi:hypothetical protein LEP48_08070 [Isoptericola sp. NEAU-Y5]|uniref:DUF3885 domain-containing protein n=1 Tax=Isoptericola luteus TaxID=2879484 RepID=A0ABS7ZHK5_9MICO|nr:hypothetical protein [Isoptericola sp. NEAU-Y5]MCA5893314.1 hypothetical protein [Isoptericola sp. NEAU-Y5]
MLTYGLHGGLARLGARCEEVAAGVLGFRMPVPERSLAWLTGTWDARWPGVQPKWLYAPYDGGADVILGTVERPDRLRRRHVAWHPDGI